MGTEGARQSADFLRDLRSGDTSGAVAEHGQRVIELLFSHSFHGYEVAHNARTRIMESIEKM
jgi:hypothetical protein